MQLNDFIKLSIYSQLNILQDKGIRLTSRHFGKYTAVLYQVDDFYAETYFDFTDGSIHWVKAFNNPSLLDPYLEGLDITPLLHHL